MIEILRKCIPERSVIRKIYHAVSAYIAALVFWFPSRSLRIIGVTGTSGKSSTTELIHFLLQNAHGETGAIGTVNIRIGNVILRNESLRTTLRPWKTQRLLREMVKQNCKNCVLEVSSHALDQYRLLGINFDTVVVTNIFENEHLDYHGNVSDYVLTKTKLVDMCLKGRKKNTIPKTLILNKSDTYFGVFNEYRSEKKYTFASAPGADFSAKNIQVSLRGTSFDLVYRNKTHTVKKVPLIGKYNVDNVLAAIVTVHSCGVSIPDSLRALQSFESIAGRAEMIPSSHPYSIFVDFAYKPSALQSILRVLKKLTTKNLMVVWGGAGGRSHENLAESAKILDALADEIIITTDDPGNTDPQVIARTICKNINRKEGEGFFEIEDRYEAIRYALLSAEKGDCVLIAGRGHETIQSIGLVSISFDDKHVIQEILSLAKKYET